MLEQDIETRLELSGWQVHTEEMPQLQEIQSVALRSRHPSGHGSCYLLCVRHEVVGCVEITHDQIHEQKICVPYTLAHLPQLPPEIQITHHCIPFLYQTVGETLCFTVFFEAETWSRDVFTFHRPETLAAWVLSISETDNLVARIRRLRASTLGVDLPRAGSQAISRIIQSFAEPQFRTMVEMPTDASGMKVMVSCVYHLLKYTPIRRVLVVSTDARQVGMAFASYLPPDDSRLFSQLYVVSARIDHAGSVCVTTIPQLIHLLTAAPETHAHTGKRAEGKRKRLVRYQPAVPIEAFDLIVYDECPPHLYEQWRQVLSYFDAFHLALTCDADETMSRAFGRRCILHYTHEQAVVDGVHVPVQVYPLCTDVTERRIPQGGAAVGRHEEHNAVQKESAVTNPLRDAVQFFRDALFSQLCPGRAEVPKTVLLVRDEVHADELLLALKEVFVRTDEFARKLTSKTARPEELIRGFCNSYFPRMLVVTDANLLPACLAPVEILLILRPLKSQERIAQLIQLGAYSIRNADLRRVSPDACEKRCCWIVDAVRAFD